MNPRSCSRNPTGVWKGLLAGTVLAACLTARGEGAEAAPARSLGAGVPEDSFFYLRCRANPERAALPGLLAALTRKAEEVKLLDGVVEGILQAAPEGLEREALREEARYWRKVLGEVRWESLLGRECALALRFHILEGPGGPLGVEPRLDWLALFRVESGERDRLLASLRRTVLLLASLEETVVVDSQEERLGFTVEEGEREGAATLVLADEVGQERLALGAAGDVIGLSSSARQLRRSLQLLSGRGSGRGLTEGEEFRRVLGSLPPPEDGELLLRPQLVLEEFRRVAGRATADEGQAAERREDAEDMSRVFAALADTFGGIKAVALTETTEGRRLHAWIRLELEEARPRLLRAFADRPPLKDLGKLVPPGATGFVVSAGVDLEGLHQALTDFVRRAPLGTLLLDGYRRLQEEAGFDIQQDILALIEGRIVFLVFPGPAERTGAADRKGAAAGGKGDGKDAEKGAAADGKGAEKGAAGGAQPAAPGALVALLRLRDPARAQERLEQGLGRAAETLRVLGLAPEPLDLEGVPGSFRRIGLPFPPGVELVFGVMGEELVLATSRDRIQEVWRARTSPAEEGVLRRLRGLELDPGEGVHTVAYRDLRDLAPKLERLFAWAGLAGAVADLQRGVRDAPPGESVPAGAAVLPPGLLRTLLPLLPRLAPVVSAALEPYREAGIYLRRDGSGFRGEAAVIVDPGAPSPQSTPGKTEPRQERRGF